MGPGPNLVPMCPFSYFAIWRILEISDLSKRVHLRSPNGGPQINILMQNYASGGLAEWASV
jgi:hypothetical protein